MAFHRHSKLIWESITLKSIHYVESSRGYTALFQRIAIRRKDTQRDGSVEMVEQSWGSSGVHDAINRNLLRV